MFITLTNSSPAFRGQKIAIRKDLIVTVHRNTAVVREDGTIEEVTFIFVPPHGTWEVAETLEEVMKLLK
jgi:hypothetical protein